jgi:hypothetical protein
MTAAAQGFDGNSIHRSVAQCHLASFQSRSGGWQTALVEPFVG